MWDAALHSRSRLNASGMIPEARTSSSGKYTPSAAYLLLLQATPDGEGRQRGVMEGPCMVGDACEMADIGAWHSQRND